MRALASILRRGWGRGRGRLDRPDGCLPDRRDDLEQIEWSGSGSGRAGPEHCHAPEDAVPIGAQRAALAVQADASSTRGARC